MMKVAFDSDVLFDLLLDDPEHAEASRVVILEAAQAGPAVICPVVYAELATHFPKQEDLDGFLADLSIQIDDFTPHALHEAAAGWRQYTAERGQEVQCPKCGTTFQVGCPACGSGVAWRQHIIPDFLIGAHALTQAEALVTRDSGYYRRYFPRLALFS